MYHHTNENMKIRTPINILFFHLTRKKSICILERKREREKWDEKKRERERQNFAWV